MGIVRQGPKWKLSREVVVVQRFEVVCNLLERLYTGGIERLGRKG